MVFTQLFNKSKFKVQGGLCTLNFWSRRDGFKEELIAYLCYFSGSLSRVKQHCWLGKRSQYCFYWPDPAFKALNGHIIGRWKLEPGILTPTSVFELWSLMSVWLSRSINFSGPKFLHMWGGAGGGKERYMLWGNVLISSFYVLVSSFLSITYWKDCLFSIVFFFTSFVID